jgi:pimeloyl-ACP methyl ester carboxylesterase
MNHLIETNAPIQEILLVPGLLEPRFALWPLQWSLSTNCEHVTCWRDRLAFRQLETSIDRMAERIAGDPQREGSIGIVTHSFGDWVARAAIAKHPNHRVSTLVSLAPVMRGGLLMCLAYALTGNIIPEIAVVMDAKRAAANLDCDSRIRRLVVWSKCDESLRSIDLSQINRIEVRRVIATHLSIVLQPSVHRLVRDFMFGETIRARQSTGSLDVQT